MGGFGFSRRERIVVAACISHTRSLTLCHFGEASGTASSRRGYSFSQQVSDEVLVLLQVVGCLREVKLKEVDSRTMGVAYQGSRIIMKTGPVQKRVENSRVRGSS